MSVALKVGHFSCHKVLQLLCLSPNSNMTEQKVLSRGLGLQISTVQAFNSYSSRLDICQCLVVQTPMDNMSKNMSSSFLSHVACEYKLWSIVRSSMHPDRAPLKEVLGGQYNYREGGRQVLRQGARGRRRSRSCRCSKDLCAQKVSGGRTDPRQKCRWKVHG